MRRPSIVLVLIAACLAATVGTAHATAFTCSWDAQRPILYDSSGTVLDLHEVQPYLIGGQTCYGGSGVGFRVSATFRYKDSSGWHNAQTSTGDATANMPNGASDCASVNYYGKNAVHRLHIDAGGPFDSCNADPWWGGNGGDADAVIGQVVSGGGHNFIAAGTYCPSGILAWDVHYHSVDEGTSGATDDFNSDNTNC